MDLSKNKNIAIERTLSSFFMVEAKKEPIYPDFVGQ
jgi:hypothetical protein